MVTSENGALVVEEGDEALEDENNTTLVKEAMNDALGGKEDENDAMNETRCEGSNRDDNNAILRGIH